MISLIVCSTNGDVSRELINNVADTIGNTPYEWVVIDNSENKCSIFQAYNEGVARAKGNVLCFVHQDVDFQSVGWGGVEGVFENRTIGVIGFGGAHFLPSTPMYWSSSPIISEYCRHNDKGKIYDCIHADFFKGSLADVAVVDGFCFFIPKRLFEEVHFDEETFQGFHAYDMDICMQVLMRGYRVCVSRDMMVCHHWSESEMYRKEGSDLLDFNMELFTRKWKEFLPILIGSELNSLDVEALDSICARAYETRELRSTKAYKVGKTLLHPFSRLKK